MVVLLIIGFVMTKHWWMDFECLFGINAFYCNEDIFVGGCLCLIDLISYSSCGE